MMIRRGGSHRRFEVDTDDDSVRVALRIRVSLGPDGGGAFQARTVYAVARW
jgi:hypothetical protein